MSDEPRKATDVLLELESKIDLLLSIVRSQDLNIKVLSNKLNGFISSKPTSPVVTAEAVNTTKFSMVPEPQIQIPISSEDQLQIDNSPIGFRRTSRPETYSTSTNISKPAETKYPVQLPKAEVIVPKAVTNTNQFVESSNNKIESSTTSHVNSIPVKQRVVDKNGKSIFLADVEVISASGEKITKTRTNGTGKWMASLVPGIYKVILSKRESLTKEKIELTQEINVDGKTTPLELPPLLFK
jgi:hypothetical protein